MDYEEEEKMQYQGSGAIPALAEEEMGEDDEYDDLYNDVNVGENFLQMHGSEAPAPSATAGNGGFQTRNAHESRVETGGSQALASTGGSQVLAVTGGGLAVEGMYSNAKAHFPEQKQVAVGVEVQDVGPVDGSSVAQKGRVIEMSHDVQVRNMGFQKSTPVPPGIGVDPSDMSRKIANEPDPLPISGSTGPRGTPQIQLNQMHVSADVNRPVVNENQVRPPIENGATTLYVGELHWWTTDAELESFASQYGRVKEIKFFDERASGKSKGYCQVDFYEAAAAAACKEGMNGHVFNGRPCVVAFASPQTLKQMGASYMNKNQGQSQPQSQSQGRGSMNDGAGRGGNANFQSGDGGRNYGRGAWGRGGQGILNRGPGGGPMRGRGGMGPKNMAGNVAGVGSGANGGGYGQGIAGPAFGGPAGGMMPHQAMMGAGFDPLYMGRGGGYGGFAGPGFPGMMPSFPAVNSMGLAGVAPHVNPAFFARGMAPNGMGMMASSGMEGPNPGKWADMSMGGWGEEPGRRTRESSYDGDEGASEYGYGEGNHEKGGARSSGASREKERVSERDWSGNSDRRHRDEREQDWDRPEREHKYKEEKDSYRGHRQRERDSGYEDDRDRGHSSSRVRSRSRAAPEEDYRSRSRDVDYGKRRRLPSE